MDIVRGNTAQENVSASGNLFLVVCSVLVPGTGHLILGGIGPGALWLGLTIALYAAVIIFRIPANLKLLGFFEFGAVVLSTTAVVDCSLRRSQLGKGLKSIIFVLLVLGTVVWTLYANTWLAMMNPICGGKVIDVIRWPW